MWSMIAASVVDLPEPVGPVTSTSPCCRWARPSIALRQVELLERHDRLGDDAEDRAGAVLLAQEVGAEARHPLEAVGEVEVAARARTPPTGPRSRSRAAGRGGASWESAAQPATGSSAPWTRMRGSQAGGQVEVGAPCSPSGAGRARRAAPCGTPPFAVSRCGSSACRSASSRVMTPVLAPARRARRRAGTCPARRRSAAPSGSGRSCSRGSGCRRPWC